MIPLSPYMMIYSQHWLLRLVPDPGLNPLLTERCHVFVLALEHLGNILTHTYIIRTEEHFKFVSKSQMEGSHATIGKDTAVLRNLKNLNISMFQSTF